MSDGYKELIAIKAIDASHFVENADRKKTTQTKECAFHKCTSNISMCIGSGSQTFCEEHQSKLRHWGGFARTDRPYSIYKKIKCEQCGFAPLDDYVPYRYYRDDYKYVLCMQLLDVDHIVPDPDKYAKKDIHHSTNHPSNLQTLCKNCHASKTQKNGDFSNKN